MLTEATRKNFWGRNHPRIADRNNKESYEVADLMAEFANEYYAGKSPSSILNERISERPADTSRLRLSTHLLAR
jgi:hypothetical protein